jgi:hypothetical protein
MPPGTQRACPAFVDPSSTFEDRPDRTAKIVVLVGSTVFLLMVLACGAPPRGAAVAFSDGVAVVDDAGRRTMVVEGWMSRAAFDDGGAVGLYLCVDLRTPDAPGTLVVVDPEGDAVTDRWWRPYEAPNEVCIFAGADFSPPPPATTDDGSRRFTATIEIRDAGPGDYDVRSVFLGEYEDGLRGDRGNEPSTSAWVVLELFP